MAELDDQRPGHHEEHHAHEAGALGDRRPRSQIAARNVRRREAEPQPPDHGAGRDEQRERAQVGREVHDLRLRAGGDEVVADEPFADVESVKAVSDILSPYTGRIAEVNEELLDNPELINQSPYEAWIVKLEDVSDSVELLDEAEYLAFIEQEG